jgi:hypothetical protein
MSSEKDPCKVDNFETYENRKLAKGQEFSTTYAFEDGTETYVLEYFHKEQKAVVRMIKCKSSSTVVEEDEDWMKDDDCKVFYYDPYSNYVPFKYGMQKIFGSYYQNEVQINSVRMGETKGSGRCSKAVSYLIKVLLLESAKVNSYPYKGDVYISSAHPCSAVNCYAHAFMNNGFLPDKEELSSFKLQLIEQPPNPVFDFPLTFFSKSQKEKYDQKSRKRRYVTVPSALKIKL